MRNFTGQKFGLILKDWTSVIKLKNFNGKCTHNIIYTESRLRKMNPSNESFVKNQIFKDL